MLVMTGELSEAKNRNSYFSISSSSFVRILHAREEVGREHIELAIEKFISQKDEHGFAHVYVRGSSAKK